MYQQLPDTTELRVRIDKKDVYSIIKKDATAMAIEFGDYGKQYAIELTQFTKK